MSSSLTLFDCLLSGCSFALFRYALEVVLIRLELDRVT